MSDCHIRSYKKIFLLESLTNGPSSLHIHEDFQTPRENISRDSSRASINVENARTTEVKTIYVNPQPSRTNSVNELYLLETKEKTRRFIIVLMALLMRCLMLILEEYFTYFFKTSFANFHLNKVFLPLLAFEVIEIQFFEPPVVKFGSVSTLLLLRLNSQHTQKIIHIFSTVTRLSQDVVVYFVTFICFDFIISIITR